MNKIETKILNVSAVKEAEQNMVFAARLTQRGHQIQSMEDLEALYERSFSAKTLENIGGMPHPTVQKFSLITVAVVGASRRFLSQITRHQNEVKFMSASLQYSNYSGSAKFAVPYEILTSGKQVQDLYRTSCDADMNCYEQLLRAGIGHDSAGYATPQGLRNILVISATLYQWKHMIGQRICRRNTDEMRIVMLKIWEELYNLSPVLFSPKVTGAFCQRERCLEGRMSCLHPIGVEEGPSRILKEDYSGLERSADDEGKTD